MEQPPHRFRRLGRLSSKQGSDPSPPMQASLTRCAVHHFRAAEERFVGLTNTQLTRREAREGRLHEHDLGADHGWRSVYRWHKSRSGASVVRNINGGAALQLRAADTRTISQPV